MTKGDIQDEYFNDLSNWNAVIEGELPYTEGEIKILHAAVCCLYGNTITGNYAVCHPKTGMILPFSFRDTKKMMERLDEIVEKYCKRGY
jgi:hypothetical protein